MHEDRPAPRNRLLYAAYLAGRVLDASSQSNLHVDFAITNLEVILKGLVGPQRYMQFESQPKRNARAVRTLTNVIAFINRK